MSVTPLLSPLAIQTYETLRTRVVAGDPCAEGLAAMRYHGMACGLAIVLGTQGKSSENMQASPCTLNQRTNPLVRLLANFMLHTHSELTHVY